MFDSIESQQSTSSWLKSVYIPSKYFFLEFSQQILNS